MNGRLHFTYAHPTRSTDVRDSFPWAKSLVVVGCGYPVPARESSSGPVVARFAVTDRYAPLRRVLETISSLLEGSGARTAILADDNDLVDRGAAIRSGAGWMGRSTMVLTPGYGPWTLFGSVVTDLDLEASEPMVRSCGTCHDCIPACPTQAITPIGLDARRCIAAWLQAPGTIPRWIRPYIERRIYGCDDCLTACPPGHLRLNAAPAQPELPSFATLIASSDDDLLERFAHWYVPKKQARHIRRNLVVAAGNSAEPGVDMAIRSQFEHSSSLVRGHAYWALARCLGGSAWLDLRQQLDGESSPDALGELEYAMLMTRQR